MHKKIIGLLMSMLVIGVGCTRGEVPTQTAERNTTNQSAEMRAEEEKKAETEASIEEHGGETHEVEPEAGVSQEFANALVTAQSYQQFVPMSKIDMYNQLTIGEGFDADATTYAIDNMDVDWGENAFRVAQEYMEHMNMSKNAIYKQLISEAENFTVEEADYALEKMEQIK